MAVNPTGFQLAGSDTMAITLTFIVWCVLNRPQLQKQLEQEVAGFSEEFTDADCDQLPLVKAVIDETSRLHGMLPRRCEGSCPPGARTYGGIISQAQQLLQHRHTRCIEMQTNGETQKRKCTFTIRKLSMILPHAGILQLRPFTLVLWIRVLWQCSG